MSEVESKENTSLGDELQIYELGYHLLPILAEESLHEEVAKVKAIVEKEGAIFIGEEGAPKSMKLSYEMSKVISNQKKNFDTAYFGWVKFEASPEAVLKMEKAIEVLPNVLRFLLIKSVRESKMTVRRAPVMKPLKPQVKTPVEAREISEVEVDKAIEELIAE